MPEPWRTRVAEAGTARALATRLGISYDTLRRVAHGRPTSASVRHIISMVYGVTGGPAPENCCPYCGSVEDAR
jgi:hypothetical protein